MVKIFSTQGSWIEGDAIRQLEQSASLPGVKQAVGMPDLHESKGCAVGSVILTKGVVYPHLVGNDVGCGYSLFSTTIKAHKANPEKLAESLKGLDYEWNGNYSVLDQLEDGSHHNGLGSLGSGNHFAELQRIIEIDNGLGFDSEYLVLLVHSGSRSLGEKNWRHYSALCGNRGFEQGTVDFDSYMASQNDAIKWATINRKIIAERFLTCLKSDYRLITDVPHNFIEESPNGFLHRKGAAATDRGLSPLPGSRATATYLLSPISSKDNLMSLPHGSGRKFSRSTMHDRISDSGKKLSKTSIGSVVVCGNDLLMKEEHHSAYKNIDRVLADVVEHDLASKVATFMPILTYKSERVKQELLQNKRNKEEDWRRTRREKNRK